MLPGNHHPRDLGLGHVQVVVLKREYVSITCKSHTAEHSKLRNMEGSGVSGLAKDGHGTSCLRTLAHVCPVGKSGVSLLAGAAVDLVKRKSRHRTGLVNSTGMRHDPATCFKASHVEPHTCLNHLERTGILQGVYQN